MTYDTAAWAHTGPISDEAAAAEYERRFEESEDRWPKKLPPFAGLQRLAALVEAQFPGESPWEEAPSEAIDGDFLYLTMTYSRGYEVEEFMARHATECGVVVYSPLAEAVVRPGED